MNNVLITIGVLIVAVLSALFAIPQFIDWNSYRGVIEEEASRFIGRDVRIGGDIQMQLLPAPSFVIQKLRVADAASGSGEPLFRAERVHARLSVLPLVRGVLEANEIELVRPVLRLVLDDQGRGNWHSLVSGPATQAFVPHDVALQSVKITDGTVSLLDNAGARERFVLDHLGGQLSAAALEGPYKFRGIFGAEGQGRELRFSTVRPDALGVMQIKATLKDLTTAATATLDGRLSDLGGRPALAGELTAQLPRPISAGPAKPAGVGAPPLAELKAEIVGDARHIALNNLSIAFDSAGRPEILAGGAQFSWDGAFATTARLTAPWIDLDNVLGNPEGGSPMLALAAFAQRINGLVPGTGTTSTVMEIEQASLGHDLVSGIRIDAKSSAGLLAVEQVRANLPGGAKVDVQGRIVGEGTATTFDGDMTLQGASLSRFAGWATAGATAIAPANDQPFQMRSRVAIESTRAGLRNISAAVGDSTLQGEVDYSWTAPRQLRVTVEGPRIDARAIAPAKLTLRSLARALDQRRDGDGAPAQLALRLQTPELVLPDQTFADVVAVIGTSSRGLSIERLQLSADHGVALALSGRLDRDASATPSALAPAGVLALQPSALRGSIAAADVEGVQLLSRVLDVPLATLVAPHLLPALVPLRLAGTVTPALAAAPGVAAVPLVLAADGQLGASDARIKITLAAGLEGWRTAPADIDVVVLAPPEARLAAKAFAMLRGEPLATLARSSGSAAADTPLTRLAVRAVGLPVSGLVTGVRFDSPHLTVYLNGTSIAAADQNVQFSGDATIDARDGRDLLADAGGLRLTLGEPLVLQGTTGIETRRDRLALSRIALTTGRGARIAGQLGLEFAGAGATPVLSPRRLTGALAISEVDAATLLAANLQPRGADVVAAAAAAERGSLWPSQPFDFAPNQQIDMAVAVTTGALRLADNVTVTDATFTVLNRRDVFEVRDLSGNVLGGRVAASIVLEKAPAGAALTAKIDLGSAQLVPFGATGTADMVLLLSGTGLTPESVVGGLSGSGSLNPVAASVREITPESLQAAIETALKAQPDKLTAILRSAVAADKARVVMAIGSRALALKVEDGVVRTAPQTFTTPEGRMFGQAAIDLATFGMTADWRVETRLPPLPPLPTAAEGAVPDTTAAQAALAAAVALPPIVQRFVLTPAGLDLARKTPRAVPETEALERELAVRKVERDLAELERLRRLDELRAAAREKEAKAAAEQAEWQRQTEIKAGKPEPAAASPQ